FMITKALPRLPTTRACSSPALSTHKKHPESPVGLLLFMYSILHGAHRLFISFSNEGISFPRFRQHFHSHIQPQNVKPVRFRRSLARIHAALFRQPVTLLQIT